jgi:virginiamycin B lyase
VAHKAELVDLRFDLYGSSPTNITIGGQQSLWVTCTETREIAALMRDGSIHRFPVDHLPDQIALGGESIWFTMPRNDTVGRIDHDGELHIYPMPQASEPVGIATAGDTAWITLRVTAELARIGVDGQIDVIPPGIDYQDDAIDPSKGEPQYIAFDQLGAAWITLEGLGAVACVPVRAEEISSEVWTSIDGIVPQGIAVDSAAAWIADSGEGGMWRIDRSTSLFERVEAWPKGFPSSVASDRMGGVWFSEPDEDLVGHMDADGLLTEHDISSFGTHPGGLAVDNDGVAWVVLDSGGVIGVVEPP